MQVELSVQDCFSGAWPVDQADALPAMDLPTGAIAPETWEIWFYRWLELLQSPTVAAGQPLHPQAAYELTLRLTDDAEIQTLNGQYRHKDQPTDVLAFAALEADCPTIPAELGDETLPLYLGDIVISVETATQQALEQGHSLPVELAWLAAHGLLHLLGWDHPDDNALVRMLDQQQRLLQAVGLGVPVQAPVR
jgi:probable rRNA maturation factor